MGSYDMITRIISLARNMGLGTPSGTPKMHEKIPHVGFPYIPRPKSQGEERIPLNMVGISEELSNPAPVKQCSRANTQEEGIARSIMGQAHEDVFRLRISKQSTTSIFPEHVGIRIKW